MTLLQMENADESGVGGNELSLGMNQILCENTSPIGMGPDYDLQQSNLALLKAELKVYILWSTFWDIVMKFYY